MRRAVIYAAAAATSAVLAGTTAAVFSDPVRADTAGFCSTQGTNPSCTIDKTVDGPASVTLVLNSDPFGQPTTVKWAAVCTLNGQSLTTSGGRQGSTPVTSQVTLGFSDPDSCRVTATGGITGTGTFTMTLNFRSPGPSPSPSPSSSTVPAPVPSSQPVIQSPLALCVDDTGNLLVPHNKIQSWTCLGDPAQGWLYERGELIHDGMCANDSGWGGNYSHVILWQCNGAANELWRYHRGSYILVANGGRLCLDDPFMSPRNGAPLIVYRCNGGVNQQWSLPTG